MSVEEHMMVALLKLEKYTLNLIPLYALNILKPKEEEKRSRKMDKIFWTLHQPIVKYQY